jgi:hypothetical protein
LDVNFLERKIMEELIRQITERTGISDEQAQQAVSMAFGFVKDKLPEPIASQLEGFLGGSGGDASGILGQVQQLGNLGGLFGGQE